MKKKLMPLTMFLLVFAALPLFGQQFELSGGAEELVNEGIEAHDSGDYEAAVDLYRRALEIEKDHPLIYFEMGFSYITLGDNENALKAADAGITSARERNATSLLSILMDLKGSALDNLDRGEEALAVFEEALALSPAAQIFYNYGLTLYRLGRFDKALETLAAGLALNHNHPSSTFLLGKICVENGLKTQALLSLCYFLLLEPASGRSMEAYISLEEMLKSSTTIGFKDTGSFTAADLMISIMSLDIEGDDVPASDAERFKTKLKRIFTGFGETNKTVSRVPGDELWWDFYVPFFDRIAQSSYFETCLRIIGLVADPNAQEWVDSEEGYDEIDTFFEWLNQ
ncbi:MAG: tetratricopeptide repeat protein [Treponema sp.]|jgi:tetratricopeptide (TPR) repeat protein|nr:tetratricopeptide repeat protein [Treponema sp.]